MLKIMKNLGSKINNKSVHKSTNATQCILVTA